MRGGRAGGWAHEDRKPADLLVGGDQRGDPHSRKPPWLKPFEPGCVLHFARNFCATSGLRLVNGPIRGVLEGPGQVWPLLGCFGLGGLVLGGERTLEALVEEWRALLSF